jgi:tRNA threonylcarbamoyladenosine biosynthesis protein TsaB
MVPPGGGDLALASGLPDRGLGAVIVLGIETSTEQTAVAVGSERGMIGSLMLAAGRPNHEVVVPAVRQLLAWSELRLSALAGVAVGIGPGLFTGMRVGIATAKTLAQVLSVPVVGLASLDVLGFAVRYSRRMICSAIDARRGEVFYAFYRPVPGGIGRTTGYQVGSPDRLAAELEALREDVLLVGNGALVYRPKLAEIGSHVEFAAAAHAFPAATALVELAVPRFQREEFDRLYDLAPLYVRKADADIAWDQHRRTG